MSAGCQSRRPDFFFPAGPWTSAKQRFRASLCVTSGQRDGPLCMRNTRARAVFEPETLPLPDRSRPGELGCGPRGDITHRASRQIRSWCVITWLLLVLYMWKRQLWKNGILSWRQQRLYSIFNDRNIYAGLTRFTVSNYKTFLIFNCDQSWQLFTCCGHS